MLDALSDQQQRLAAIPAPQLCLADPCFGPGLVIIFKANLLLRQASKQCMHLAKPMLT